MFKRRFPPAMGNDLKLNYKIFKRREGKEKENRALEGSGPFQWDSVGEDCQTWDSIGISHQHDQTIGEFFGTPQRGRGRKGRDCRLLRLQCTQMWERLAESLTWTFFSASETLGHCFPHFKTQQNMQCVCLGVQRDPYLGIFKCHSLAPSN